MSLLSSISIIACSLYIFIGFYGISYEKKSRINQLFLAICIGMAIWSFAYAFVYVTGETQYIWMKISAIGWCTFSSFILHLVLLLTENKWINRKLVKVLLYVPSALFFYISVFLFWNNSFPSRFIQDFFNIGDFIYHFLFLLLSIILIAIWGSKSNSIRKRKQARILVITSLTPFLLNLLTQNILPSIGILKLPNMGHLYSLIMVIGVYYGMIKYRLFEITPKQLMEELLHEMMDLMILVSPEGRIITINTSSENLLGYSKRELLDKPLEAIIQNRTFMDILNNMENSKIYNLSNVNCIKKDGYTLPVNLTCSLIIDPTIKDMLGMVIVGQDITLVKKLEQEVEEHKKAEDYIVFMANHDSLTGLPNRKYFYQILNQTLERASYNNENFAVLFLDLDDLKFVNDNYGHDAGDQLLCEVGLRAKSAIKKEDIVARIGGDEFTFLIFSVNEIEAARETAYKIIKSVNKPINIYDHTFNVSSSIGVSFFPDDGTDMSLLIKKADDEMYIVKKRKKQCS